LVWRWSLCATLLAAFAWLVVGHGLLNWPSYTRFEAAAQNASVFAKIVAVLGLWALLALTAKSEETKPAHTPPRWLYLLSVVAAMILLVRSSCRIETSLFVVLSCLMVMQRILTQSSRRAQWLTAAFIAMACVFTAVAMQNRFAQAVSEAKNYLSAPKPREQDVVTSIGTRLEIYHVAQRAIAARPWLGWGAGSRPQDFSQYYHHPQAKLERTHLHSQYLQTLVDVGILGFLVAFVATALTVWLCVVKVWTAGDQELALAFASLLGVHLLSGVFNPAFSQGLSNSFFVLMMAVLITLWRQRKPRV
jgi:O-antigen ligase